MSDECFSFSCVCVNTFVKMLKNDTNTFAHVCRKKVTKKTYWENIKGKKEEKEKVSKKKKKSKTLFV